MSRNIQNNGSIYCDICVTWIWLASTVWLLGDCLSLDRKGIWVICIVFDYLGLEYSAKLPYLCLCLSVVCVCSDLFHSKTPNCAPVASQAQWSRSYMLSGISHTQACACKHTWISFIQLGSHVVHTYTQMHTEIALDMEIMVGVSSPNVRHASHLCTAENPSAHLFCYPVSSRSTLQITPLFATPRIWGTLPP